MGFVYFIREKNSNSYKVGCSRTRDGVDARLCDLQTGNPKELELFALIECDNYFEKEDEIQTVWDNLCIRNEWFSFTEAQVLVLLKAYGGFLSPLVVLLPEIVVPPNADLESVCKRKIDGSLGLSIRQIVKSLNVKKWEVEAMLKKLQVEKESVI